MVEIRQIVRIGPMTPENQNRRGQDLDVWGGATTTPVLIPKPGEPCILQHLDGTCPDGCSQCMEFAETMNILGHREHRGHGE